MAHRVNYVLSLLHAARLLVDTRARPRSSVAAPRGFSIEPAYVVCERPDLGAR